MDVPLNTSFSAFSLGKRRAKTICPQSVHCSRGTCTLHAQSANELFADYGRKARNMVVSTFYWLINTLEKGWLLPSFFLV